MSRVCIQRTPLCSRFSTLVSQSSLTLTAIPPQPITMYHVLGLITILIANVVAQRPGGVSICDYYAEQLYGANRSDTQLRLVQTIVAAAFGGGSSLPGASSLLTGILNPGTYTPTSGLYQAINVDLRPWFNGSLQSTNLNNQGVGVNWLDGGGLEPLLAYANGSTANVTIPSGTNQ